MEATPMPRSPNITALLAAVREAGSNFQAVESWMWFHHSINVGGTQRAAKSAEAAGLVKVTKPNRARARTWTIEIADAPPEEQRRPSGGPFAPFGGPR